MDVVENKFEVFSFWFRVGEVMVEKVIVLMCRVRFCILVVIILFGYERVRLMGLLECFSFSLFVFELNI